MKIHRASIFIFLMLITTLSAKRLPVNGLSADSGNFALHEIRLIGKSSLVDVGTYVDDVVGTKYSLQLNLLYFEYEILAGNLSIWGKPGKIRGQVLFEHETEEVPANSNRSLSFNVHCVPSPLSLSFAANS